MLVFDTSAYLNGRRDHYPPATFPSVWDLVATAMADGRIVAPRAVYLELVAKDDEVTAWCKQQPAHVFVDPIEAVQRRVGAVYARFANPGRRDGADPFRDRRSATSRVHGGDLRGPQLQRRSDAPLGSNDARHLQAS